jgi:glycosyltransferase involved in cell wall biosynthesis
MTGRPGAVYLCYFPISDPLVDSQVLAYLRGLAADGFRIHLITFELSLKPEAEILIRDRLERDGITWSCLYYRPGGSLLQKCGEGLRGVGRLIRVILKNDLQIVHARAHPAALMAYPVARLLRRKLLFDVRGLIADEYADIGRWSRSGYLFRGVKRAETFLLRHADAIVFLTRAIVSDLVSRKTLRTEDVAKVTVIPCCVDIPRAPVGEGRREFVLAYVGKLGSWYLDEEILRFFVAVRRVRPSARLLVLTQSPGDPLRERLALLRLSDRDVWIGAVAHSEVSSRLQEASAGVAFYRPGYSKLATSPTKVGDYLAAGLPVAINASIGDCDLMLRENKVGVSLQDFSEPEIERAATLLVALADEAGVRDRCRDVARKELDLGAIGVARYRAIYEKLGS